MMLSKDNGEWADVVDTNIAECLKIVKNCDFKHLHLSAEIESFIHNISSKHKCDEKVLFYTILAGISHYAESVKVYNMEARQVKPTSVFEILIAPSGLFNNNNKSDHVDCLFLGVEKSKYINIISNSCTKIELYIYEEYYKKNRIFMPTGVNQTSQESQEKKKNIIKTFDGWISEYGSIKQVYTTPSLLQMMADTSIFFLANEGDGILQESSFFNPSDVAADTKQGTLIDCKLACFLFLH
jgi:hypothetical protein